MRNLIFNIAVLAAIGYLALKDHPWVQQQLSVVPGVAQQNIAPATDTLAKMSHQWTEKLAHLEQRLIGNEAQQVQLQALQQQVDELTQRLRWQDSGPLRERSLVAEQQLSSSERSGIDQSDSLLGWHSETMVIPQLASHTETASISEVNAAQTSESIMIQRLQTISQQMALRVLGH